MVHGSYPCIHWNNYIFQKSYFLLVEYIYHEIRFHYPFYRIY